MRHFPNTLAHLNPLARKRPPTGTARTNKKIYLLKNPIIGGRYGEELGSWNPLRERANNKGEFTAIFDPSRGAQAPSERSTA